MSVYEKIVGEDAVYRAIAENSNVEAGKYFAKFFSQKGQTLIYNKETKQYFLNSFFPSFPSKAWDREMQTMEDIKNGERKIFQSDIVVTGKCHCNCWHCYHNKHARDDLKYDTILSFLKQAYDVGVANVGITGGEPMVRKDIKDIVLSVPDGMQAQLFTTGHNIDQEFCDTIKKSNLTRVIISLDHFKEEVVNKTRNNKNAFHEALDAIKLLQENKIYTVVTVCIISDFSLEEIDEYFQFVAGLGVQEVRVVMPIPQGKIEGMDCKVTYKTAKQNMMAIKKKYKDDKDFPNIVLFSEFESAKYVGCSAGKYYVTVNNDGKIQPCVAVPLSFGNIYEDTLKDTLDVLSKYFVCSGKTCYGRKIGRIMQDLGVDTSVIPLDKEKSLEVAEHYIVKGTPPAFYDDYFNNNY